MNIDLSQVCHQVINLAKETGSFIKSERNKNALNIEIKGKNDFVTHLDKLSEEKLVAGLEIILPNSGFLVEENTATSNNEAYIWIIDPIDGTTNFIHGLHNYAISIALSYKNEIILGVVYEIGMSECFHAIKNQPAMLNGVEIKPSNAKKLNDCLVSTGFPYNNYDRLEDFINCLTYLIKNTHGIRRLGSAAVDLAYVACGRFDLFFEYNLKPWDVAAGAFIVQQAGGKVADFSGHNNFMYGQEIIASTPLAHAEFQNIVTKFFTKP